MKHEAKGPDVDLRRRLDVPEQQLRRHVPYASAVYILLFHARNRSENAEIHYFELDLGYVQLAISQIRGGLSKHNVLVLHVSVDDLAAMAVVDGVQKLKEKLVAVLLTKLTIVLRFPEVVQLSSSQILHHDNELLLLWQWEVIVKFDDVPMPQFAESFDFFSYQMTNALFGAEIEDFDRNFLLK